MSHLFLSPARRCALCLLLVMLAAMIPTGISAAEGSTPAAAKSSLTSESTTTKTTAKKPATKKPATSKTTAANSTLTPAKVAKSTSANLPAKQATLVQPAPKKAKKSASRSVAAKPLRWEKAYQRALDRAAEESRPVLVIVSAPWCGPCRQLHATTLVDRQVTDVLQQKFVGVKIDADTHPQLVQQLQVQSLPTTLVLSPDQKVLQRMQGYVAPQQMNQMLTNVSWKQRKPVVAPAPESPAAVSALTPANVSVTRVALARARQKS